MNIKMSLEISVFFLEFTVNISITYHYVNNKFELISNSMWFRYCHRELSINQLSLSGIDFSLFYWKLTKTIILLQIHHESTIFLAILQCIHFFIPNPLTKQSTKLFSPILQKTIRRLTIWLNRKFSFFFFSSHTRDIELDMN